MDISVAVLFYRRPQSEFVLCFRARLTLNRLGGMYDYRERLLGGIKPPQAQHVVLLEIPLLVYEVEGGLAKPVGPGEDLVHRVRDRQSVLIAGVGTQVHAIS